MSILIDSGFLYAVLCKSDENHADATKVLGSLHETMVLPIPAVTEVVYLLGRDPGPDSAADFIEELARTNMVLEAPTTLDYFRAASLMRKYIDSRLDFVDALITAIAERLNIKRILTVDQRDFRMIRPAHCDAFELLP